MRKITLIFAVAVCATLASCTSQVKLTNSATYKNINVMQPVTAVLADLDVSPKKIRIYSFQLKL